MWKNLVAMLQWLTILSSVAQSQGCAQLDDVNGFGTIYAEQFDNYINIAPGSIAPSVVGIDGETTIYDSDKVFIYLNFRFSDGTNKGKRWTNFSPDTAFSVPVTGTINAIESCARANGWPKGIKFYVHGSANPIQVGSMDNCGTYKPKAYLQGPFLGFTSHGGGVIDSFLPLVDKCYEKYATISAFNIPEPNIVFQLGTSHTQTLQPIVAMPPAWAHLPAPPARMFYINDDLTDANGTTF